MNNTNNLNLGYLHLKSMFLAKMKIYYLTGKHFYTRNDTNFKYDPIETWKTNLIWKIFLMDVFWCILSKYLIY